MVKILFLICCFPLSACGVKKAPTPLYSYPMKFEADSPMSTPIPSPSPRPEPTDE